MHAVLQSIRRYWLIWRLIYRTLFVIRFPIIMASISALVLYTDQGQDILRFLAESEDVSDTLIFTLLAQLCGLIVWHVSRTLYRFKIRRHPGTQLMTTLVTWAPRLMAAGVPGLIFVAAIFAIHIRPEQASGRQSVVLLALLAFASGINFLITWWRRWLSKAFALPSFIAPTLSVKEELNEQGLRTIHGLARSAQRFYLVLLALTPLSILWVALSDGRLPDWMGAGAVTMLALALSTVFGSMLTYFAMRTRLPLFGFALFAAVLFSLTGWNDNHQIRLLPDKQQSTVLEQSGMMDDVADQRWQQIWTQRFGDWSGKDEPVVFVASSGGGIRAAYWTAQVLGLLSAQSEALQQQIFSISGVSGGSVGAAVYAAIQRQHERSQSASRSYSDEARAILGQDLLTPILSTFLFPDIAQRFMPFPLFPSDRAVAGETALEQFWYVAFPGTAGQPGLNPLENSLDAIRPERGGNVPFLILNITDLPTGQRVIAHNLDHEISPIFSFAEPDLDYAQTLRLSTAAFLSARFPYVTPSGIHNYSGGGGQRHLRLGDGGYFENSGALSTQEVLERLYIHRSQAGMGFLPVVIQIDNDPGISENLDQNPPGLIRSAPLLGQLLDPITGLAQVRSAHGYRASEGLRQWTGASRDGGPGELVTCDAQRCPHQARGHYFHFRLYDEFVDAAGNSSKANPMPLGWLLSDQAKREIECQLFDRRNLEETRRLLTLFQTQLNADLLEQQRKACHHL